MFDRDHIAKLKAAADPKRVAATLGLRGRGGRFFCPVCQSDGASHKTPDLAVRGKGFCCFKCGLKGDLLKLVEVALGLDFQKAVQWLERETGIRPPNRRKRGCQHSGHSNETSYKRFLRPSLSDAGSEGLKTGSVPAVYEAFLGACRQVEGAALDWLTSEKGVAPEVVAGLRLRFCGREYLDVMNALKTRFGEDALLTAGLLKRSDKGRLVPSFWHYYANKVGFLVVPYLLDGRPVYLKARPPMSKSKAERLGLARFLNTAASVPCLYNVDALSAKPPPDKVLICEGESDTWTALSAGFAAVGSPGAGQFKPAWVECFRAFVDAAGRSRVYLVPDADTAGAEGARVIADMFLRAGLSVPLKVTIPSGKDLNEYLRGGMTA